MPVLQGGDWVQASDESMEELIEIMRNYEKLTQKLKKVETLGWRLFDDLIGNDTDELADGKSL